MQNDSLDVAIVKRMRAFELRVDASFPPGITLVAGPSGAGKTTLLRTIAGTLRADAGSIRLAGTLLADAPNVHVEPKTRDLGLVFQDYALFPHLDVAANVAYGLAARRVPRVERDGKVAAVLERLGIADFATRRPATLSAGERQRVALARALVIEPRALLLDEPLAALDVLTRARVRSELAVLLATLRIPTVLVSHDPADAVCFPDRVLVLEDGTVAAQASLGSLDPSTSAFVAAFLGAAATALRP